MLKPTDKVSFGLMSELLGWGGAKGSSLELDSYNLLSSIHFMSQARFLSLVSDAKTLHPIVDFLFNAQPLSFFVLEAVHEKP